MCDLAAATDTATKENIPGWNCAGGTPSPSDICAWGGVSCNSDFSVTSISLPYDGISGTLPTSIGTLLSLIELYYFSNQLFGTLPTSMGGMSSLKQLNLNSNRLNGIVPQSFCSLKLDTLSLSSSGVTCYPGCLSTVPSKDVAGLTVCPTGSITLILPYILANNNNSLSQNRSVSDFSAFKCCTFHAIEYPHCSSYPTAIRHAHRFLINLNYSIS